MEPTSFQLCTLDTIGKIFEQVIAERLRKHFRGKRNQKCLPVYVSSWLLQDQCNWKAQKAHCIGD